MLISDSRFLPFMQLQTSQALVFYISLHYTDFTIKQQQQKKKEITRKSAKTTKTQIKHVTAGIS